MDLYGYVGSSKTNEDLSQGLTMGIILRTRDVTSKELRRIFAFFFETQRFITSFTKILQEIWATVFNGFDERCDLLKINSFLRRNQKNILLGFIFCKRSFLNLQSVPLIFRMIYYTWYCITN